MADVMAAFLSGHQAAQAEAQHEQAMEENKLRQMVLKHQMDGIKIENELRARAVAESNLQMLHGQPAADLPSDPVTTTQQNLPSQNLAGMVTGLIRGRQGLGDDAVSVDPPPETVAAPAAQAETPGTNSQTTMVPRAIDIPGVPSLGQPGVSVRPRSLEDVIRAQVATKLAEPFNLNEGQTRFVGGQPIARGTPKPITTAAGARTVLDPSDPNSRILTGGARTAPEPSAFSKDMQERRLKDAEARTAATRAAAEAAAAERKQRTAETTAMRLYTADVANGWKQHADKMKEWETTNKVAMPGEETEAPIYTPPSLDEWQALHPERAPGGAKPAAGATPKFTVGQVVKLKNGKTITIGKVYPDGTFDPK